MLHDNLYAHLETQIVVIELFNSFEPFLDVFRMSLGYATKSDVQRAKENIEIPSMQSLRNYGTS